VTCGSPYGITVNPAGTTVYVANWQASVAAFSIDPGTGALTAVPGSPFTASYTGWGWQSVAIHPAGTRAYVGTGNGGQLLGFDIDPATGALTQDAALTYGSAGFNYVTFNAAGTYAYLSNAWDVTISITRVDPVTGRLTTIPSGRFGVGTRPDNIAAMQP
jgi:6-phosphogluconolactonase